jgi:hypothetical protein
VYDFDGAGAPSDWQPIGLDMVRDGALLTMASNYTMSVSYVTDPVPFSVVALVVGYENVWQDAISAHNVTSYMSWLARLRPFVTTVIYKQMVANIDCSTNCLPDPAEAYEAEVHNWAVRASVGVCTWDPAPGRPTKTWGDVACGLFDTVVNRATGRPIPTSELPFGWTSVGNLGPTQLFVTKASGSWLVEQDATGENGD